MFRQFMTSLSARLKPWIHHHPYLAIFIVLVVANLIGMGIQYTAIGYIDFSRLSTTLTITLLAFVAVAAKQRIDRKKKK